MDHAGGLFIGDRWQFGVQRPRVRHQNIVATAQHEDVWQPCPIAMDRADAPILDRHFAGIAPTSICKARTRQNGIARFNRHLIRMVRLDIEPGTDEQGATRQSKAGIARRHQRRCGQPGPGAIPANHNIIRRMRRQDMAIHVACKGRDGSGIMLWRKRIQRRDDRNIMRLGQMAQKGPVKIGCRVDIAPTMEIQQAAGAGMSLGRDVPNGPSAKTVLADIKPGALLGRGQRRWRFAGGGNRTIQRLTPGKTAPDKACRAKQKGKNPGIKAGHLAAP